MSKKKKLTKDTGADDVCRYARFFIPAKSQPGRVFVQWDGDDPSSPPTFNLNYIDDRIANAACDHRVVAYHVGHDHGFGYRHRHYFSATNELDDSHNWDKCTSLFFDEASCEVMKDGRVPSTSLDIETLMSVMTQ